MLFTTTVPQVLFVFLDNMHPFLNDLLVWLDTQVRVASFALQYVCLVQPHAATCAVLVVLFRSCFCTQQNSVQDLRLPQEPRIAHVRTPVTTTEIQQGYLYSSRAPTLPATLPWPCLTRVARGAACVSPPPRHAEPRPAGRSRCVLAKPPSLRACAVVAARHHWLRLVSAWATPFPSQPPRP